MGSLAATTFISNIRVNLNESHESAADLLVPTAGSQWKNSELLENLNKSKDRLWEIIREVREDYFLTIGTSLNLTASAKSYDLAAGFRQLKAIKATTAGYEDLQFESLDQSSREWKERDALPASANADAGILYYDIVGTAKILFCNFPPAAITAVYNYVGILSDFTLSASSTVDIGDELREFLEGYATWLSFAKTPTHIAVPWWKEHLPLLERRVVKSVSKRQIRDPKRVAPFNP